MHLFSRAFWRAAGIRAGRTVLVAAIPLLAPIMTGTTEVLLQALAALAFAALLSVVTSLVSLPETGSGHSRWAALVDRGVRSAAQVAAAALAAAALWSDVDWRALGAQALVAGLTSVMLGIVDTLPEVDVPAAPVPYDKGGILPSGAHTVEIATGATSGTWDLTVDVWAALDQARQDGRINIEDDAMIALADEIMDVLRGSSREGGS